MKVTKRQLRRIIREEKARLLNEAPSAEAHAPSREDVERSVQAAIAKYTSSRGQFQWRQAQNDFEMMADGEVFPGITDVYYAGWTPEDFQTVIDSVKG